MRRRSILDVARHDVLDLRRQRGVWVGLLLIPFVTISFLLLLPGVLAERERVNETRAVYQVAVQGSLGDVEALQALLPADRFVAVTTDDARGAVSRSQADVGIRLDGAAAAALAAADGQVTGDLVVLGGRTRSRVALGALAAALEAEGLGITDRRLAARNLTPAAVRPIVVDQVDLSDTSRGRRLNLATLLPLIVLLPVAGTVGVAAQRISGSKDQRVFEPLLVLPYTRPEVLLGKALSATAIGTISLGAVGLPLLVGRALPVGTGASRATLPIGEVMAVVGIAAVLLVLLVSLGMAIGAASRTSAELGSVLQMATLPIFLLGSLLQFRSGIATTVELLVLPFFGLLLCVRDVAVGG
ncbi:MAG: ABC transporter permease subunit, partial [Actinomycetota bacterium]|nr:ABC transporter permease subunit [Actinomycetota bacterium]